MPRLLFLLFLAFALSTGNVQAEPEPSDQVELLVEVQTPSEVAPLKQVSNHAPHQSSILDAMSTHVAGQSYLLTCVARAEDFENPDRVAYPFKQSHIKNRVCVSYWNVGTNALEY